MYILYIYVNCSSLVATLTISSDCRAFIEYHDSRKTSHHHRAIFSEQPVLTDCRDANLGGVDDGPVVPVLMAVPGVHDDH